MKKTVLKKTTALSIAAVFTFVLSSVEAADGPVTGEDLPTATSDTDRVNNYDTVSSPRWRRNTTTQKSSRSTTSSRAMRPVPSSGETLLDPASERETRSTGETINRGPGTSGVPANGTGPGTIR